MSVRPSRIGKLERVGRVEGDRFVFMEVPAPPEARSFEIVDDVTREVHLGYEIRHACPHCHGEVAYRFGQRYSDDLVRAVTRNDAANRSLYERERMVRQILDAYDPDAGAEIYLPEALR